MPGTQIRILILTVHEDEAMLREVMRSGASGYILKHAAENDLIEAIKLIMQGDIYVDQKMLPSLIGHESTVKTKSEVSVEPLSPREVDILKINCGWLHQPPNGRRVGHQHPYC